MPPLGGIPSEFLDETYSAKTRGMGLLHGENCAILSSTVFDRSTRVTDGQMDGRAIAYSALSIMLSRATNVSILTQPDIDAFIDTESRFEFR